MCAANTAEPGPPGLGPRRYQPTLVAGGISMAPSRVSPTGTTAASTPMAAIRTREGPATGDGAGTTLAATDVEVEVGGSVVVVDVGGSVVVVEIGGPVVVVVGPVTRSARPSRSGHHSQAEPIATSARSDTPRTT